MPRPTTEGLSTDFKDLERGPSLLRAETASFREGLVGFRGRAETQLGFLWGLGAFTTALLVTLAGSVIWLSWNVSALNQRVNSIERSIESMQRSIDRLVPPAPKP